jgi:uncharacterized protein YbaR (Trm112 family)
MNPRPDAPPAIPTEVRQLLACPQCRGALTDRPDGTAVECPACRLRYPIREGLPVLLIDAAEGITP